MEGPSFKGLPLVKKNFACIAYTALKFSDVELLDEMIRLDTFK